MLRAIGKTSKIQLRWLAYYATNFSSRRLALILDIAEDVPIADIEHGLPRIEAAMLDLLVRYANSTPSHDQLVNLNHILARFQKIVDRYAGAGNARLLVHAATQLRKR